VRIVHTFYFGLAIGNDARFTNAVLLIGRDRISKLPSGEPVPEKSRQGALRSARRRSLVSVGGQGSPGVCDICGRPVEPDTAFVNIGATDWTDPSIPRFQRFVPAGSEIHGWSPFVVEHPECFSHVNGPDALDLLRTSS
jgi:hypothetical protein